MPAECQLPWTSGAGESGGGDKKAKKAASRKVKIKYSCPACELNVWGRGGLRLRCMDCDEELAAAGDGALEECEAPAQKAA